MTGAVGMDTTGMDITKTRTGRSGAPMRTMTATSRAEAAPKAETQTINEASDGNMRPKNRIRTRTRRYSSR